MSVDVGRPLPAPEPGLTPAELIARAAGLREKVRSEQDQSEARGCHSPELQEAFVKAGFYRALQPKRFGGYEFDYASYYKAMLEICRGDPGVGWCLILGSTHGAQVASHWPEQAQVELFGADGDFIAPHRAAGPAGRCRRVEGGYLVEGVWNYSSGIPYSTHFIGNVMVEGTAEQIVFIVPRKAYEILGDWGGESTLGMRASGSNSVRITEAFVPAHWVVPMGRGLWSADDVPDGTFGTRLHGNPMYLGRMMGPYHASLVATVVGAARAALDEMEAIAKARKTRFPPIVPWTESVEIQRPFGQAMILADTAESVLIHACELQMDYCRRWAADGTPFTVEDSLRLWGMLINAGGMACDAVDLMFRAASSSAAMKGQRMARYYRDCAMYRGHSSSQLSTFASGLARLHFGQAMGMFGV
ncbi:MAG TPA: acyl-CoA dehydrogenase family protein [Hyphomicrobiaceae bacterium]|nr:acyl-CoA dehydrogenase family protein [Hyphomicrobiaceae bacterium]